MNSKHIKDDKNQQIEKKSPPFVFCLFVCLFVCFCLFVCLFVYLFHFLTMALFPVPLASPICALNPKRTIYSVFALHQH